MIPERSVGYRSTPTEVSVSPKSRQRSVSANPESSRNTSRGLLPDFYEDVPSPNTRKRVAAHSATYTDSVDVRSRPNESVQKRRPVPAAIYAQIEELHGDTPVVAGSGVQSTGITPLITRSLLLNSAHSDCGGGDELEGLPAEMAGFQIASPHNSRRAVADKAGSTLSASYTSKLRYLDADDSRGRGGVGRGDVRREGRQSDPVHGGVEEGRESNRPLRMYAVTWNLAGKLPPASIASIVPAEEVDIVAVGTQECLVNCGTIKSFVQPGKAKWERRMQVQHVSSK